MAEYLTKPFIPQFSAALSVHDHILLPSFFPTREHFRQGKMMNGHWATAAMASTATPTTVKGEELVRGGEGKGDLNHDQLYHLRYGPMASWLWDLLTSKREKKLVHRKVYKSPHER